MKKIIAIATVLTVAAMIAGPGTAQAITAEELEAQIAELMATLAGLQEQLVLLQGGTPSGDVPAVCVGITFTAGLSVGSTGAAVKCLQAFLNTSADTKLAETGPGSPGQETTYFGPITKAGVVKFQEKYAADILASWGLTAGTGYVGETTRAKLNVLLASAPPPPTECSTDADCDEGEVCEDGVCVAEAECTVDADCAEGQTCQDGVCVTTAEGALSVTLAADTPAASTVATGANDNFTKFILTASDDGDVKISKIYITRSGLTANSDLENIKVIDAETGEYKGSIGSLNVNSQTMITFVPNLVIEEGTSRTFFIRAGFISTATAGKTAELGIAEADDIVSNAASVAGDFPIVGETKTVVSLTIGTASVNEDGSTVDSKPDVGDEDVTLLKWKVTAGSTEGITLESVTFMKKGTHEISDIENIELYDATNNVSLGTVTGWSSEEKATFSDLDIVIDKGKTNRFKVLVDVADGAESTARTIDCDMIDGTDVLLSVKGNTYGFYITPTILSSWDGTPNATQEIQSGALHVSKSASTPPTGNIAVGDDIVIGVFDFEAKGEDIKITAISADFTAALLALSDITNVGLYDEDDEIVAGPKAVSTALTTALTAAFTDTFIIPVGTHEYTLKATLADSVANGTTILGRLLTPGTTTVLTATGMTSNDSITATPSGTVSANTLTVAAGTLVVNTLSTPTGRSIPKGSDDFVWATFSLDAGAAGESANVTSIVVTDSYGGAAAGTDIDSAELWADLTDGTTSDRGDVYETKITDAKQWTGDAATGGSTATQSFTMTETFIVERGTFTKIALVADLNASAGTGNHTFTIANSAASVVATGTTTGEATTESYGVANAQTMLTTSAGTLTVTKDASTPVKNIIIGGDTGVTLAVFRLAANNVENLDLDHIDLAVTNAAHITTLYFYNGDTLLGSTANPTDVTYFSDGTLTIPANSNKLITIKADLADIISGSVDNNDEIRVSMGADVDCTGALSGNAVDSSTDVTGNYMYLYESRPYFSLNSASPSGDLYPSSNSLLAIFDVKADAGEDISFEQADNNTLKVNFNAYMADTANERLTFTLKDGDGNTLESDVQAAASNTTSVLSSSVSFQFNTTSFYVPKGETKMLYLYGNTTDMEDDGDSIQVYLDDTAANIDWGIDTAGTYNLGDIIFRGDIYAGSFSNPS